MKKELNLMITPAEFPVPLIILPETDSTNNYLTQLCNEQQSAVREFTTVIAERQTAGKGQRGNSCFGPYINRQSYQRDRKAD